MSDDDAYAEGTKGSRQAEEVNMRLPHIDGGGEGWGVKWRGELVGW